MTPATCNQIHADNGETDRCGATATSTVYVPTPSGGVYLPSCQAHADAWDRKLARR